MKCQTLYFFMRKWEKKNGAKLKTINFSDVFYCFRSSLTWSKAELENTIHRENYAWYIFKYSRNKKKNALENYSKSTDLPRGFLSSSIFFCGHTAVKGN